MKLRTVGMWAFIMAMSFNAFAQDEYSDEDLTKYASVMNWANDEKAKMSKQISSEVNGNEVLPGSVYKSLKSAFKAGDVNSTDATEDQVAEFLRIQGLSDTLTTNFSTVYKDKIKSDIGAGLYNKLRKALKSDPDVKARYDAIMTQLKEDESEADADSKE